MAENMLNDYRLDDLQEHFFRRMGTFTASSIHNQLKDLSVRLNSASTPIALSFGENCGPAEKLRGRADKLRGAEVYRMGSSFFDNIVVPVNVLPALLDADFARLFELSSLTVGTWEGNDSVMNTNYGVYFHHYFYLRDLQQNRDMEKRREQDGRVRRAISEADIPLFLPAVMAQFEYLMAKLRLVLRSSRSKILLIRKVDGFPIERSIIARIEAALVRFGAVNTSILAIYSTASGQDFDVGIHRQIEEEGERWGRTEEWGRAIYSVI